MSESSIQPELLSLKSKLTGEIDRDEKQIEALTKRVDKNKTLLHAVNGSLGMLVAQATGYGAFTDNIRAVIRSLPNARFNVHDIEEAFRSTFPTAPMQKSAVRSALWNLMKRGGIRCTKPGNNRQPAEYERIEEDGLVAGPSGVRVRRRTRPTAESGDNLLMSCGPNGGHA
jgi:hypothetical protein